MKSKKEKKRTAWNSTLAPSKPKKRKMPNWVRLAKARDAIREKSLARGSSLATRKPMARGKKQLRERNPEQSAKRRKRYSAKLAAYKRSETYKLVEARAAGRCEGAATGEPYGCGKSFSFRCFASREAGAKLTHHHKTYARFGGDELPDDIEVLCEHCHAVAESAYAHRRHGR